MADTTPTIATDLLRVALDPTRGTVRRTRVVDIGLRAALFCDLILDGYLGDAGGSPFVDNHTLDKPTGDHVLDTLLHAVNARPYVAWWRWYRHVRADRLVLTERLVDEERWQPTKTGPLTRHFDTQPDSAQLLGHSVRQALITRDAGDDPRLAILAVLTQLTGAHGPRPQPRSLRRELRPLTTQIEEIGDRGHIALTAITGATVLIKKPLRR